MFSSRVPSSLAPNALAVALRAARAASRRLIDLTVSNPTIVGVEYSETMLRPLHSAQALTYEPQPFGLLAARQAVADDYVRRGVDVAPEHVVLTSSTSDAYSLLFKLLCAPAGDAVLTPTPSYPLFEHLTRLDGVTPVPYALEYHGRWLLDRPSIERLWTAATRAVLAVSPNNPTGSCLSPEEHHTLAQLCASRGAALILDEVFADYPLAGDRSVERRDDLNGGAECLTFRLGGLSKSAGLPQVKLGWFAVQGPAADVNEALARLEFICDAYLPVSTPVQIAAPELIAQGAFVRHQILERVRRNYERLRTEVASYPELELLAAEAGWSAVLRVPARTTEEEIVLDLLNREDVIVHPGFFFDFPNEAFLVVSLLPPPPVFDEGLRRIVHRLSSDLSASAPVHVR
jgi:aspartate/methionine/tyrosine aminotransferase